MLRPVGLTIFPHILLKKTLDIISQYAIVQANERETTMNDFTKNHNQDNPDYNFSFNPPEGTKQCDHCNGYGSSLKDPEGVDTCTKCKGSGLIPKETK